MNKIILALAATTLFAQGAIAATCKEVKLNNVYNDKNELIDQRFDYVAGGSVLQFSGLIAELGINTAVSVINVTNVTTNGVTSTITTTDTFRGLKLQPTPANSQGAPSILTNGKATLEIEQDWNPNTNLGKGEIVFFNSAPEAQKIELFCPNMNIR